MSFHVLLLFHSLRLLTSIANDSAADDISRPCTSPLKKEENIFPDAPIIIQISAKVDKRIRANEIVGFMRGVLMRTEQLAVIEGAGGWRVPLNNRETLADPVKELQLPVILVVGMKLGCISHALLTAEAIQRDGLKIIGWVANCIDKNMAELEANIASVEQRIDAPLLGVVPNSSNLKLDEVAAELDIQPLLQGVSLN